MATIKSYTDISQSKKLAEILPLESADMFYNEEPDEVYLKDVINTKYPMVIGEEQKHHLEEYGVPCWSLAALVEAMPKYIIDEYTSKGWLGMCLLYYSSWRWIVYYSNEDIDSPAIHEEQGDTLLDAAYNMVCWLIEEGHIKK